MSSDSRFMRLCSALVSCPVIAPPSLELMLRVDALHLAFELVERADVGLGRRDYDVGVGADAVHDAATLREPHGDLALRLGAGRHGVDRKEQQLGPALGDALDRLEGRIHRPVSALNKLESKMER